MNKLLKFLISIPLCIGVWAVSGCDKLKNRDDKSKPADTDNGKKNL